MKQGKPIFRDFWQRVDKNVYRNERLEYFDCGKESRGAKHRQSRRTCEPTLNPKTEEIDKQTARSVLNIHLGRGISRVTFHHTTRDQLTWAIAVSLASHTWPIYVLLMLRGYFTQIALPSQRITIRHRKRVI